ncbi:hypothetical protein [Pseudoalteromonas xiamenensis]
MSQETINLLIGSIYILAIVFAVVAGTSVVIIDKKRSRLMKINLKDKIQSEIDLSASDVVNIGKAFRLTPYQSRRVVYQIFSEINDKEPFNKLKTLVQEIEKEEPFDDLPDEVKPSMIRLTTLTNTSSEPSDKQLLSPISHTLKKYVDLLAEQDLLRKKTNRAWLVTLVSFVIGAISFYFTVTAPTASEIATQLKEISSEHNKQIKQD